MARYDNTPADAIDYERFRVREFANCLRNSYHLGRKTEPTITAYQAGRKKLPEPTRLDLERDLARATQEAVWAWNGMKDIYRETRAKRAELESRTKVEEFVAGEGAGAAFEAQIADIEARILGAAYRARDHRKLADYLTARLAAMATVAQAAE